MANEGQLAYSYDRPAGLPGLVIGVNDHDRVRALLAVAADPGLVVRVQVGTNTDPPTVELPLDDTGVFYGVIEYDPTKQGSDPQGSAPLYAAGDVVTVVRRGRIWCRSDGRGAPNQFDDARVVTTNGAGNQGQVTGATVAANLVKDLGSNALVYYTPRTAAIVGGTASDTIEAVEINFP